MTEAVTSVNKYYLLHSMLTSIYNSIDERDGNCMYSLSVIINGDIYRSDDILDYIDNTGLAYITSKLSSEREYNLVIVVTTDELILIVNNA